MTHVQQTSTERARRKPPAPAAACLLILSLLGVVAIAAGCGGSNGATPNAQASGQQMQVMATVTRGDLVETAAASLQLTKNATGGAAGVGRVMAGAVVGTVAQGQPVTVYFLAFRPGARPGSSPYPTPSPGQTFGPGAGGQGGFGPGGGFDNGQFMRNAKHATGTIASVQKNSDGSLTIHVTIAKLPAGAKAASFAMARLSSQVLAKNVLLLPTEAISGSGSNATVQVLVNGKTEQRHVVVGKQTRAQAEIVSGLNEGDNVIYTRTFRGFGGFGSPRPGAGGYPQGAFPSGAPPGV